MIVHDFIELFIVTLLSLLEQPYLVIDMIDEHILNFFPQVKSQNKSIINLFTNSFSFDKLKLVSERNL